MIHSQTLDEDIADTLFSTYFYKNAGLPTEQAFNLTLAQYGLGFFGTIGSWVLMSYFGRRTLYLGGLIVLMVLLIGIGGAGFAPANDTIVQTKRAAGPAAGSVGAAEVCTICLPFCQDRPLTLSLGTSQCCSVLGSWITLASLHTDLRHYCRTCLLCHRGRVIVDSTSPKDHRHGTNGIQRVRSHQ